MSTQKSTTWSRLLITEEGGFAGLSRGAALSAEAMDEEARAHVSACLVAVQDLPAASRTLDSKAYPDRQSIHLECHGEGPVWQASFDRAALPEAVRDLLSGVKLKAVPLRS